MKTETKLVKQVYGAVPGHILIFHIRLTASGELVRSFLLGGGRRYTVP